MRSKHCTASFKLLGWNYTIIKSNIELICTIGWNAATLAAETISNMD